MITPLEVRQKIDKFLLSVQKPGRYVGGEYGQFVKDWDAVQTHFAIVFPDLYDIGVPNLGVTILYDLINSRSDALCERSYLPWVDMESLMRENNVPLYSLESFHPLADFDIIGFTLPYETIYTNVLNVLDLAQIPLHSKDRDGSHPLIIAGGHAAYNPEPMSKFIDAFVIGEGEEVIHEILVISAECKKNNLSRAETLIELQQIPGIYIPFVEGIRSFRSNSQYRRKTLLFCIARRNYPERWNRDLPAFLH